MNLEDDLRRALRRTDPPLDFANRVIAEVKRDGVKRESKAGGQAPVISRLPIKQWFAAAAMLTLVAAGGARYYQHQQQLAEAERAQAEVMLALQVTSDAFAIVQAKLQDSGR